MVLFTSRYPEIEVPDNLTTWDWLFESKEYSPLYAKSDKPLGAFIDAQSKERLDWAEVKSKSTSLSNCLSKQYGLVPGATVSVFSGNSIWYPVCMFATLRAGGRVNGASPALTVDEIAHALRVAETKIIIVPATALDRAVAAAKQVGIETSQILLTNGSADGFRSIQDLIEEGATLECVPPYQLPAGTTNKELCGYLLFSSGTTGLPKAVMLSHHNMMAQAFQMRHIQVDPDHFRVLAIMPMYHVTGAQRFCLFPVFMNGDAVILPTFTMPAMLEAICQFKIEEVNLVPPLVLRMARDAIVAQYDLRHVKRWTSGAAPISPEVIKSLQQRFPWTGFRQAYGATESSSFLTANPPGYYDFKYGASVGMLTPNTTAKIINTKGEELGVGEMGEIIVKGPQIAMGYLNNEQATAESFDKDNYYHTGDAGCIDENGWLYITDRIKEMIKVKGTQVPPAELDDLLLSHEYVADCAVVGRPDEYAGERPIAYVVLKANIPVNEVAGRLLLDYVRTNKVRYKWLAEIEFVDSIPKSPAGKLLRRVLKERAREEKRHEYVAKLRVRDDERVRLQVLCR